MGKSGGVGGEAAGICGVRGELCKEVTEGGGFALEIVITGWVFENEGGCKCWQCRMCEESGPSGDEGGRGGLAQQCWGVACFGPGEVGDERGGFLAPTASHFDVYRIPNIFCSKIALGPLHVFENDIPVFFPRKKTCEVYTNLKKFKLCTQ